MKIEVLYIADCPNHRPAVDLVRDVMRTFSLNGKVDEVEVRTSAEAESLRFLGSPTVRVNGVDVEPEARTVQHFGLGCRSYLQNGLRSCLPSVDLLRHSFLETMPAAPQMGNAPSSDGQREVSSQAPQSGVLVAGGVAAVLASTCCLGPLILVTLGFSGAWIGNLALLEPYRPWFLVAAAIALWFAGRRIFRKTKACAPGQVCALPDVRRAYKMLFGVVAALVVVAIAFPYVAPLFY